ncbi:MAG: hypothetical protein HN531_13815 [Opitutae bacterium]|nr:hypothetical protein [Opitutae bacterium]
MKTCRAPQPYIIHSDFGQVMRYHNRGTQKRGFTTIGKVTINKGTDTKSFEAATGFFIEKNNPN